VKGGDYTVETVVGHDIVDEVVIFPTLEGKSTTNIIKRIKEK
jgi:D-beta-D-heptose 7-phosphate kinase/D-beta-D-heptose 1-phosphate adenosyltransferase